MTQVSVESVPGRPDSVGHRPITVAQSGLMMSVLPRRMPPGQFPFLPHFAGEWTQESEVVLLACTERATWQTTGLHVNNCQRPGSWPFALSSCLLASEMTSFDGTPFYLLSLLSFMGFLGSKVLVSSVAPPCLN